MIAPRDAAAQGQLGFRDHRDTVKLDRCPDTHALSLFGVRAEHTWCGKVSWNRRAAGLLTGSQRSVLSNRPDYQAYERASP